jgi:hypothetical protein
MNTPVTTQDFIEAWVVSQMLTTSATTGITIPPRRLNCPSYSPYLRFNTGSVAMHKTYTIRRTTVLIAASQTKPPLSASTIVKSA